VCVCVCVCVCGTSSANAKLASKGNIYWTCSVSSEVRFVTLGSTCNWCLKCAANVLLWPKTGRRNYHWDADSTQQIRNYPPFTTPQKSLFHKTHHRTQCTRSPHNYEVVIKIDSDIPCLRTYKCSLSTSCRRALTSINYLCYVIARKLLRRLVVRPPETP
jgi:hypothetical protein